MNVYVKALIIAVIIIVSVLLYIFQFVKIDVTNSCVDFQGETIRHDLTFEPGPSVCSFCTCYNSRLKWCQSIVCNPPVPCRKFRLGKECCDFECLDHLKNVTGSGKIYVFDYDASSSSSTQRQTLLWVMSVMVLLRLI